jgi:delta14-sterol reductase
MPKLPDGMALFSWEACAVFAGWIAYTTALHLVLPGMKKEGIVLSDGTRLAYKLNGMRCFVVTMSLVGCGVYTGRLNLAWVHDNFLPLLTAGVIFSYGGAVQVESSCDP